MPDSIVKDSKTSSQHLSGHRERLRERFINDLNIAGESKLPDYELLEIILFAASARRDVKPLAKELIQRFGNLAGVLSAQPAELRTVDGMGDAGISALKIVKACSVRAMQEHIAEKPLLSNFQAVIDYCTLMMSESKIEQFRIFFLDKKNRLIADEMQQTGTVDHTPVYPREVVKRALELGATAVILVHNHPSGDVTPSHADLSLTKDIMRACAALGILVHDHLIISRKKHYSFAAHGQI